MLSDPTEKADYDASQGFAGGFQFHERDNRRPYEPYDHWFGHRGKGQSMDFEEAMRQAGMDPKDFEASGFTKQAEYGASMGDGAGQEYRFDFSNWNKMHYGPSNEDMHRHYSDAWERMNTGSFQGSTGSTPFSDPFKRTTGKKHYADKASVYRSNEMWKHAEEAARMRTHGSRGWVATGIKSGIALTIAVGMATYWIKNYA